MDEVEVTLTGAVANAAWRPICLLIRREGLAGYSALKNF
jgi:hypothetical protein